MIKKIQVKNESGVVTGTYDVGQIEPAQATAIQAALPVVNSLIYSDTNTSGVIEIKAKTNGNNTTLHAGNNVNLEPREAVGTGEGKAGQANAKGGNIALKPGDDIELWGHHRGTEKDNEVSVKVMTEHSNGEHPTELQLQAANIVLTTKEKSDYISYVNAVRQAKGKGATSDQANVLNVEVKTGVKEEDATYGNNEYGYLKVRAQAIDLRSVEHGGIALQPKCLDSDGHMNQIKF